MANPQRGEKSFEAFGKTWTLRLDINALCALEDALGYGTDDLKNKMTDPSAQKIRIMRTLMWAALTSRHSDITQEKAGEIIGEIGIPQAMDMLLGCLNASFEEKGNATNGGTARPTLAQAG